MLSMSRNCWRHMYGCGGSELQTTDAVIVKLSWPSLVPCLCACRNFLFYVLALLKQNYITAQLRFILKSFGAVVFVTARAPTTLFHVRGQTLATELSLWPVVWNSLPEAVRHADSLHCFKRRLKSHFLACVLMIDGVMPFRSGFAHGGHCYLLTYSVMQGSPLS